MSEQPSSKTLVERLRAAQDCGFFHFELFKEAATEIERLQNLNASLLRQAGRIPDEPSDGTPERLMHNGTIYVRCDVSQARADRAAPPPRAINCGNCQTPDYCNNIRGLCAHAPVSALTKTAPEGFPPETPAQERSMRRDRYPPRDPVETSAVKTCPSCGYRHGAHKVNCPTITANE